MPSPLVVQHYPSDYQILTYNFASTSPSDPTVLLYADRPLVIDSIHVTVLTATTASGAGALSFEVSQDPTSVASTTIIAVASTDDDNVDAGDVIILDGVNNSPNGGVRKVSKTGTAGNATGSTQLKFLGGSNTTIDNVLPAGYYLLVDVTGTVTTTFKGLIQIRFRSRLA